MKRQGLSFRFALLFTLFSLTGCSLIDFGIGAAIDHERFDERWDIASEEWGIQTDDSVRVVLRNSSALNGKFLDAPPLPPDAYEEEFNAWVIDQNIELPRLGEPVVVRLSRRRVEEGVFGGFDVGAILLHTEGERREFPVVDVRSISDQNGMERSGSDLRDMLASENVPFNRAVHLHTDEGDPVYPISRIDSIYVWDTTSWKWIGLGVGLTFDLIIVAVLSSISLNIKPLIRIQRGAP